MEGGKAKGLIVLQIFVRPMTNKKHIIGMRFGVLRLRPSAIERNTWRYMRNIQ